MKISELIKELEYIKRGFGDIEVNYRYFNDKFDWYPILVSLSEIKIEKKENGENTAVVE